MIAAMEKPLATRTLIAVTSEVSRIAFFVVIDSSLWAAVERFSERKASELGVHRLQLIPPRQPTVALMATCSKSFIYLFGIRALGRSPV
jgi:hypothetical protein